MFKRKKLFGLMVVSKDKGVFLCYGVAKPKRENSMWRERLEVARELVKRGYRVTEVKYTTDRLVYLKALLKAKLHELTTIGERHTEVIDDLVRMDSDVAREGERILADYEDALCISIGRVFERIVMQDEDFPITDERIPWCVQRWHRELDERREEHERWNEQHRKDDTNAYC